MTDQSPNWCKIRIMKNRTFRKFEWSALKLLDWRILLQIPLDFWGSLKAPRPPAERCATCDACRRTPLWKFLPTGLRSVIKIFVLNMLLDLNAGYWQVEFDPKDKSKTTFATRQGLFKFNVMPFELWQRPGNIWMSDGDSIIRLTMAVMSHLFGWCDCAWENIWRNVTQHRAGFWQA